MRGFGLARTARFLRMQIGFVMALAIEVIGLSVLKIPMKDKVPNVSPAQGICRHAY